MKQLVLALAAVAAAPAALADIWINPGFYSQHFDKSKNLNDNNRGFGVEASINNTYSVTAGVFENSNRETSHYIGAYVMPFQRGAFKAGAAVGAFDSLARKLYTANENAIDFSETLKTVFGTFKNCFFYLKHRPMTKIYK